MKSSPAHRRVPAICQIRPWLISTALLCAVNALAANQGAGGLGVFAPAAQVAPAPTSPQFDITGFVQEATLDSTGAICQPSDPRLAGGVLRVNDVAVIVPCNTVLQMPAATLTWQELFALAPRDIGLPVGANGIPTQTGLALKDAVTMPLASVYSNGALPSYEAHVQGNVVNGMYIAGLIFISQQNLNIGQGTITSIDYNNGELQIASAGANASVARVKINDALGRFGLPHGGPGSGAALIEPTFDARFSVDAESPTVHAVTGFPMCLPRSDPFADADDPLCPQANRPRAPDCAPLAIPFPPFAMPPAGQFCTSFMMPPPPRNSCTPSASLSCPPDATQQAPFEVGDFIDFLGTLKFDSRGPYISAHTIVDHVGIFTSPGIMPAYATIEMELQGTAALPVANLPQESTSRVKIEGFTTDPTNLIDIYAVDVHPVTGNLSERLIGIASPFGPPVVGRFRFKPNAGAFLPPVREFRVVSRTLCADPNLPCRMPSAPQTYANGLIAGQYHAPNFEFIFPENLVVGDAIVSSNFQDFPFLYCGSGPLTTPTAGTAPPLVGQLNPPPWALPMMDPIFRLSLCPTALAVGSPAPVRTVDLTPTPKPPSIYSVKANPSTVMYGRMTSVTISVMASDPNKPATTISYAWTKPQGVTLSCGLCTASPANATVTATFTPTAAGALTFGVSASNGVLPAAQGSVSVIIAPSTAKAPTLKSFTASASSANVNALITLTAIGNSNPAGSKVIFGFKQTGGPAVFVNGAVVPLGTSIPIGTLSSTAAADQTAKAAFIAPPVSAKTNLSFQATLTDSVTGLAVSGSATQVTVSLSPDTVVIAPVTWDNRQRKGKLNVAASSSAITGATVPTGMSMTVTFWNKTIAAGLPGSANNPIIVPMSVVKDVPGQPPVCPSALPCFFAPLVSVIVDPASSNTLPAFLAPTSIVVKSSLGGGATVTGSAITVR